ncbi:hypothetical protein [Tenacibaculum geojense]|uniref:Lipoprotein n=1 Tax=Tenacibaculum geojense TaxID=915352 RepID=A0ABW3JSD1_9FLAO
MNNLKVYKIIKLTTTLLLVLLLVECKAENTSEIKKETEAKENKSTSDCPNYLLKNKENNWNVSILLDLSDRISETKYPNPTMEYFQRDLGYIQTIATSFLDHIKTKKMVLMNDYMQLYFEPEPADASINEKAKQLQISFDKNLTQKQINEFENKYAAIPSEIYSIARSNSTYLGSDTWRFFKDKVKRYCIKECNRNILVILTDGYMFHVDSKLKENNRTSYITPKTLRNFGLNTSSWENKMKEKNFGFIPANSNLEELEVLVLGVVNHDKKANPYGFDIMKKYWENWFDSMGIKKYQVYGAELPANMENTINQFLNN